MTLSCVEENIISLTEQEDLLQEEILGLWMSIFLKSAWQILELRLRKGNVIVATEKDIGLKNALRQLKKMDLQSNKEKDEKEKEKERTRKGKERKVLKRENPHISDRVKKKDPKRRKKREKKLKLKRKKKTNSKLIVFTSW